METVTRRQTREGKRAAVVSSQMESNVGETERERERERETNVGKVRGANRMGEKTEKQIFNQMELLTNWGQAE